MTELIKLVRCLQFKVKRRRRRRGIYEVTDATGTSSRMLLHEMICPIKGYRNDIVRFSFSHRQRIVVQAPCCEGERRGSINLYKRLGFRRSMWNEISCPHVRRRVAEMWFNVNSDKVLLVAIVTQCVVTSTIAESNQFSSQGMCGPKFMWIFCGNILKIWCSLLVQIFNYFGPFS